MAHAGTRMVVPTSPPGHRTASLPRTPMGRRMAISGTEARAEGVATIDGSV
jgi:hypothetical protein